MFLYFIEEISVVVIGKRSKEMNISEVFLQLPDVNRIAGDVSANQNLVELRIDLERVANIQGIVKKIGFIFIIKTIV